MLIFLNKDLIITSCTALFGAKIHKYRAGGFKIKPCLKNN